MSKVIDSTAFEIYRINDRFERAADRLQGMAIRRGCDEDLFRLATHIRDLHQQMKAALGRQERARLEGQLEASLELIGRNPGRMR